jgi:TetR/AcrR family transcriptional regulator, transcriptional repressor for nem operon
MSPGPAKSFDPDVALERARNLFWRRGYDGTGISELEAELGIGRKSLYDTFGSKRELFLRALGQYTDTVIQRICDGLQDPGHAPLENLERVLRKLQEHHGSPGGIGCLLGVAMAQAGSDDPELAALLRGYLRKLEVAFEHTLQGAQREGAVAADVHARDAARNLVALVQGMALIGRITDTPTVQRSAVRAALQALKPRRAE